MRKIYVTEDQFRKYLTLRKQQLKELNVNGDQFLAAKNGDVRAASQAAIDDAQSSGVNTNNDDTSVQFSADALRNQSGINEVYTKKQIAEARVQNLLKNAVRTSTVKEIKKECKKR